MCVYTYMYIRICIHYIYKHIILECVCTYIYMRIYIHTCQDGLVPEEFLLLTLSAVVSGQP